MATYKVEPYVMAADVYACKPHVGRGGWTWYTGSAGWMYRLIIESLLGLRLEGNQLGLDPRMPADWQTFKIHYRYKETPYHITVTRITESKDDYLQIRADGHLVEGETIPLADDGRDHHIEVQLMCTSPRGEKNESGRNSVCWDECGCV